ncbi:hypothetical protein Y1Q_0010106 [Alligator mississippiensis]|uniref:Uncharacterized protein n=1 Tax=Alligator mississippiensis TaxID=8496 RepID=A0A151MGC1_ALLMI|nr:hypothetical protein Y1Q_0010106 [Alligator mississippiensis]
MCLELLAEPVLLECGHHFCQDCITQYWAPLTDGPFSCPQCRAVFLEPRLASSQALSNLVSRAQGCQQVPVGEVKDQSCKEHRMPISLFCLSPESPICHVCVGTPGHAGHSFSSLQDAMRSYKEQLEKQLEALGSKVHELQEQERLQEAEIAPLWVPEAGALAGTGTEGSCQSPAHCSLLSAETGPVPGSHPVHYMENNEICSQPR